LKFLFNLFLWITLLLSSGCTEEPWNNPYSLEQNGNILFTAFSGRPKHLDPARSYSSDEYAFLGQIYEPPLQYHYLKRPYQLEPLTAVSMPEIRYYDVNGKEVSEGFTAIHSSEYLIEIKPGIQFQPHPAFVINEHGQPSYLNLKTDDLKDIYELSDFTNTASRELTAKDYVYQIKRMGNPEFHSPILGLMSEYIEGLDDFSNELKSVAENKPEGEWLDLRKFNLRGVQLVDRYRYKIRIKGLYPQFEYWLSMPFFAPMAYEVERFYQQQSLIEKNITLDWYPAGTGAYYLEVNNPNKQMILQRNPNFRGAIYPSEGMPEDNISGLLNDRGKQMPFIDRIVFSLEKESIPRWNKFLQGYYDSSGISSDSFDQAVDIGSAGEIDLTDEMKQKGISLKTSISSSIYYFGFNMLDDVVGGYSEQASKLRRAIAIAVDYEEYISIFLNGRGVPGQSPIPPGIFGHIEDESGVNNKVYETVNGVVQRRSIEQAKQLLSEAGYENGIDPKTGQTLILYLDTTGSGPDSKSQLAWWRKQFEKLDIQLVIRNTDYNRFRSKVSKGTAQMYQWGWNADYPDPENFLFLLYGPNSKVTTQGENASNYSNVEYDRLFEKMKDMKNGSERQQIINQMIDILRHDSPWLWGFYPKDFSLHHDWYFNSKPNAMAHNTLMYKRIDFERRNQKRELWNQPVWWPLAVLIVLLLISVIPAWRTWKRSETESQIKLMNRVVR
jgi:ABC-type transport system substrate-binding protein